jgi:diguanylate cyclase (GGDEF)-like protein/PAS domain S-box-containing protein
VCFSFEQVPVGLAHVAFDGQILQVNSALGQLLGCSTEALAQLNYFCNVIHSADLHRVHGAIQKLLKHDASSTVLEHRCRSGTGDRSLRVHLTLSLWRDSADVPQHFIAVLQSAKTAETEKIPPSDPGPRNSRLRLEKPRKTFRIELFDYGLRPSARTRNLCFTNTSTELRPSEVALYSERAEMDSVLKSFPDVFVRLSENGELLDYKVQKSSELYLSAQQWQGMSVRAFLPERVSLLFERAIAQVIQTQTPASLEYSLILSRQKTFFEARLFPTQPQQALGIIRNISDRKQIEAQLLYDALHDPLTGLPNRTLFMDRVEMAMCRFRRQSAHLYAVLFIDLDRFKLINDNLGHVIGDQLLREIADVLRQCVRAGDTVARLGGDEFTILLTDIKALDEVAIVADRIQEQLKVPILIDGNTIPIGASVGIVLGSSQYSKAVDLLRDADIALYRAKENGKGCYAVFEP